MKNLIRISLFLLSFCSVAQDVIVENLNDFDELKVFNGLEVNLVKSDVQKLEIKGLKATQVSVRNKKSVLKIFMKLKSIFDTKSVKITLFYNGSIAELDANQGAVITSNDVFSQTQLNIDVQDGAHVRMNLDVDYLKINAITGGNVYVSGKAKSQKVEISTGSNYNALDLTTRQTDISATTGAEAQIHVQDILDAKVKLGGMVNYIGNPKSIKTTKFLGGMIREYVAE
jgi:hypothetical protein